MAADATWRNMPAILLRTQVTCNATYRRLRGGRLTGPAGASLAGNGVRAGLVDERRARQPVTALGELLDDLARRTPAGRRACGW